MRYKRIGNTGLAVSELCLGTNTFGGAGDNFWRTLGGLDQTIVNTIVAGAIDAGINFLDTADSYSNGESEERIGSAIKELHLNRHDLVIATKIGGRLGSGPNASGASRVHILNAVEGSLRRLQVDHIDLCMVHYFDPATPLEETLRVLDRLVQDGKIRYLGCSNFAAWETMKSLGISRQENLARFEFVECHWSIATRELEREIVPLVLDQKLGLLVWGPLLGGLLTGKFAAESPVQTASRTRGDIPAVLNRDRLNQTMTVLSRVAIPRNATPGQIALAWLLHQPAVTSVLFGTRTVTQLVDNIDAANIRLTAEELDALDQSTAIPPEYGPWLVRNARSDRARLV
ncbi:MAG TPA: aldo/keto reductase [Steroidobacteraceae bacterium]